MQSSEMQPRPVFDPVVLLDPPLESEPLPSALVVVLVVVTGAVVEGLGGAPVELVPSSPVEPPPSSLVATAGPHAVASSANPSQCRNPIMEAR